MMLMAYGTNKAHSAVQQQSHSKGLMKQTYWPSITRRCSPSLPHSTHCHCQWTLNPQRHSSPPPALLRSHTPPLTRSTRCQPGHARPPVPPSCPHGCPCQRSSPARGERGWRRRRDGWAGRTLTAAGMPWIGLHGQRMGDGVNRKKTKR